MPGSSYAEIFSRPSALHKSLLYKPPSSAARRLSSSSPIRQPPPPLPPKDHLSTSVTADIPSSLLPYYLSKAEYNTRAEENETDSVTYTNPSGGDHIMSDWRRRREDEQGVVDDERQQVFSHSSLSLRSPPFRRRRSYADAPGIPSPPSLHCRTGGAATPSASSILNRVSTTQQAEQSSGLGARQTLAESGNPISPALKANSLKTTLQGSHPEASMSPGPSLTVYTEEQRRAFEAQVMQQVEALLQAQRGESHADLETYRVTAAEAQATLQTVEAALEEQVAGVQHRGSGSVQGTLARVSERHEDSVSNGTLPHTAPVTSQSPLNRRVEKLAANMSRIAAATAEDATGQILDVIMSVEDSRDVPSALQRVVSQLYHDLASTLIQPVMEFAHQQSQLLHEQEAAASTLAARTWVGCEKCGVASRSSDEVLHTQAEVAALQEEVGALRRLLCSVDPDLVSDSAGASIGDAVLSMPTTNAFKEHPRPPQKDLVSALQNRLFSECHAMLTRSRHEALLLRRSLEEERRQHFLTRLQLLKPRYPLTSRGENSVASFAAPSGGAVASLRTPTGSRKDCGAGHDLGSSPRPCRRGCSSPLRHSSSATRSPASSVPGTGGAYQQKAREEVAMFGGSMPSSAHPTGSHHWTPARAPLYLPPNSGGAREQNENGAAKDRSPSGQSPALPVRSPPVSQGLSTPHSCAAPFSAISLQSAMQVAEEVLRTTAPATYSTTEADHPYYRCRGEGTVAARLHGQSSGGSTSTSGQKSDDALSLQRQGESCEQPPCAQRQRVSFLDSSGALDEVVHRRAPPLSAEASMSNSPRAKSHGLPFVSVHGKHEGNTSTGRGPMWDSVLTASPSGLAGSAPIASAPPSDPHERRVWEKTVELLNRYSIA